MRDNSETVRGNISERIEVSPGNWQVTIDYYPDSRSWVEYYFESKEEADSFIKDWNNHESNRKS